MNFHHYHGGANRLIEAIHDRMSVILDEPTAEDWMIPGERDPARLKSLLVPAADDSLVLSPASSLANSVKNNGPELLVPIELSLRNGACF
jgi:putative SOS response-associated peptidase YedK